MAVNATVGTHSTGTHSCFHICFNENEPYKLEERTTNLLGDVSDSGRDVLPVAPAVSPVQPRAVLVWHRPRTRYREGTTEWIVYK